MSSTDIRPIVEEFTEVFSKSAELYKRGCELYPNGVTHDGRFLRPFPVYIDRGLGPRKWTVEGIELIDWWSGHGSIMLGHSHPDVVNAVQSQIARATHPGACHEYELEWGEAVRQLKPSIEKMRFVSSGTEATMMALRLSRTFTGKDKTLKFKGHFHGWNDFLIQDAYPPYEPVPGLGVDLGSSLVTILPNDLELLEHTLSEQRDEIGSVIIEPTGGHYGYVPIRGEFLKALRELTDRYGMLLIFDEVITGFRVSPGGAQAHYDVTPDLTTLAKILAGGLPGGCVGGREEILEILEIGQPTTRKMPHPGTFNANPLSASAGVATLKLIATGTPNEQANAAGKLLRIKLNDMFEANRFPWIAYGDFSAVHLLSSYDGPRVLGDDTYLPYSGEFDKLDRRAAQELAHAFRCAMLVQGIDPYGMRFMTNGSHTEQDVLDTVAAVERSIYRVQAEGF